MAKLVATGTPVKLVITLYYHDFYRGSCNQQSGSPCPLPAVPSRAEILHSCWLWLPACDQPVYPGRHTRLDSPVTVEYHTSL